MRKPKRKKYLHTGEYRTIQAIADLEAISYDKLARHIRRGETIDDAITLSRMPHPRPWVARYHYDGQDLTITEIAALSGVAGWLIRDRLKRGLTIEQATSEQPTHKQITVGNETHTFEEWASRLGLTVAGLRERLAHYNWTMEEAFKAPRMDRGQSRHRIAFHNRLKIRTIISHAKGHPDRATGGYEPTLPDGTGTGGGRHAVERGHFENPNRNENLTSEAGR